MGGNFEASLQLTYLDSFSRRMREDEPRRELAGTFVRMGYRHSF